MSMQPSVHYGEFLLTLTRHQQGFDEAVMSLIERGQQYTGKTSTGVDFFFLANLFVCLKMCGCFFFFRACMHEFVFVPSAMLGPV